MRRRLEGIIPIVLLAVLVQIFAPVAAFRVVAYAVSDPLYFSSICSDASSSDQQHPGSDPAQMHGKCCGFCSINHGSAALATPPAPLFVSLQREFQLVSWLQASAAVRTSRLGSNTQARAPPSFS